MTEEEKYEKKDVISPMKKILEFFFRVLIYLVWTLAIWYLSYRFIRLISNYDRGLHSEIHFTKNHTSRVGDDWVDDCSCSDKTRSEIRFYFGLGGRRYIRSFLRSSNEKWSVNLQNRNFIFHGKPGTGKSHCASLIAKNISSFHTTISGSLQRKYIGSGASAWEKVINNAKKKAAENKNPEKPVVIVVEEIDSLANKKRSYLEGGDTTLVNTFLESIDSIKRDGLNIIILGTTNVISSMEPAAIRVGRFNQIHFRYPNKEDLSNILEGVREQIEKIYKTVNIVEKDVGISSSEGIRQVVIKDEYWTCLRSEILKSLKVPNQDIYPLTFVQTSSCVERVVVEAIEQTEHSQSTPMLGEKGVPKTVQYIIETADREQRKLLPSGIKDTEGGEISNLSDFNKFLSGAIAIKNESSE